MSLLFNPHYKPHLDLVADDATWDALKLVVTDWLSANAGATISDEDVATIRTLDPQLLDEKIWSQMVTDLGLTGFA